jgi:hypothetical protein
LFYSPGEFRYEESLVNFGFGYCGAWDIGDAADGFQRQFQNRSHVQQGRGPDI